MKTQTLEEWVKGRHPRHVAARRRQLATHDRAIARKNSASAPKFITRRKAKEVAAAQARAEKRIARRAKYAAKISV